MSLWCLTYLSTLHILVCIVSLIIFVDELKHIIGNETTRRGLLCVFELFQRPVLNRRLLYVLLEGVLETLFPQHNLSQIFRKLHSRSGRVRDDFKTSQRTRSDLRRWASLFSLFFILDYFNNATCFYPPITLYPLNPSILLLVFRILLTPCNQIFHISAKFYFHSFF